MTRSVDGHDNLHDPLSEDARGAAAVFAKVLLVQCAVDAAGRVVETRGSAGRGASRTAALAAPAGAAGSDAHGGSSSSGKEGETAGRQRGRRSVIRCGVRPHGNISSVFRACGRSGCVGSNTGQHCGVGLDCGVLRPP